jgi:hypothetical protein
MYAFRSSCSNARYCVSLKGAPPVCPRVLARDWRGLKGLPAGSARFSYLASQAPKRVEGSDELSVAEYSYQRNKERRNNALDQGRRAVAQPKRHGS